MKNNVLWLLEENAALYPRKKFLFANDGVLTFAEFRENSRNLASFILEHNDGNMPVAVFMEKGAMALTAFFGALYGRSPYCLLNPALPKTRLKNISDSLKNKIVITSMDLYEEAVSIFDDCNVIKIEEHIAEPYGNSLEQVDESINRIIDTDPLYINFTSGSTGIPKGIVVSHRSVLDFIRYFTDIFDITEKDVIANQAPFDFDVSVKDIYSCMYTGASLVIVPKELFSKPVELIDFLCEHDITVMTWAVSALCLISTFHGLDYKIPEKVQKILFSGEAMPYKHLNEWRSHLPDVLYANLYGPTEITCNCTYYILEKDKDYADGLPIGKSFPNEDVFLLDENDKKITASGSKGEICVRGSALALGYYSLDKNIKDSFTLNPLNPYYNELIYRTGDLAFYNENFDLVFAGRKDFQIKYMGHRIELEEIERAISHISGVERACCVFDEKRSKLRAFYVGYADEKSIIDTIKIDLPVFMIPSSVKKIETMPLNKNGKIDRNALMELEDIKR